MQKVEHIRSQSNITLEAIRTGNPETACKNLVTFINLGLVDDAEGTIRHNCETSPASGPSLPVSTGITTSMTFTADQVTDMVNNVIRGVVLDADTYQPIADVSVSIPANSLKTETDKQGRFMMTMQNGIPPLGSTINAEKAGYEPIQSATALYAGAHLTIELHKKHCSALAICDLPQLLKRN
jgi:hypothetical protein